MTEPERAEACSSLTASVEKAQSCESAEMAVDILEQTLVAEQRKLPVLPQITLSCFFVELGRQYNALGMHHLTTGATAEALATLQKAQTLSQADNTYIIASDRLELRSITLNNLACIYKALNKPHTALACL